MSQAESLVIRAGRPSDAAAAMDVLRRSITELCTADHGNDPAELDPWLASKTEANWLKWLAVPGAGVLVAEVAGRLAGVGMINATALVQVLYVAPEARFAGVSSALLAAMEDIARADECATISLDSTATARRFYLARGYLPVAPGAKRLEKPLR
ncbi:GNAT family N-acetyltransferase [Marinovum sp.]|uniref:GNAT family N-acetyltransferase n=1 Tax=Marinovum sp. TaxID=2024839 RepID=UPI003A8EC2CE